MNISDEIQNEILKAKKFEDDITNQLRLRKEKIFKKLPTIAVFLILHLGRCKN